MGAIGAAKGIEVILKCIGVPHIMMYTAQFFVKAIISLIYLFTIVQLYPFKYNSLGAHPHKTPETT